MSVCLPNKQQLIRSIMDFKKLCQTRYSVRAYKPDLIPDEKMDYIKACVQSAPSAVNKQPWKFIILTQESDREKLQQCYDKPWFKEAPVYIIACKNENLAWTRRYDNKNHADIDLAIAIELFDFQDGWEPVALIPLGFPADDTCPEKTRKSIEEIWETW